MFASNSCAYHGVSYSLCHLVLFLVSIAFADPSIVHPIVALNITDHVTRCPTSNVLGVLLGKSFGSTDIEIVACFGIQADRSDPGGMEDSLALHKKVRALP